MPSPILGLTQSDVLISSAPASLAQQASLQSIQLVGPHIGQSGFPIRVELDLEGLAKGADRLAQPLFDAFAQSLLAPLLTALFTTQPFGQAEGAAGVLLGDLGSRTPEV